MLTRTGSIMVMRGRLMGRRNTVLIGMRMESCILSLRRESFRVRGSRPSLRVLVTKVFRMLLTYRVELVRE